MFLQHTPSIFLAGGTQQFKQIFNPNRALIADGTCHYERGTKMTAMHLFRRKFTGLGQYAVVLLAILAIAYLAITMINVYQSMAGSHAHSRRHSIHELDSSPEVRTLHRSKGGW